MAQKHRLVMLGIFYLEYNKMVGLFIMRVRMAIIVKIVKEIVVSPF